MTIRKPARLLLVDDDPGLLKLLGMRLVSEGYSVVTAESGPEALRVLGREKVDLVIKMCIRDSLCLRPCRRCPSYRHAAAFNGR